MSMTRSRPFGVTLLAIFSGLSALGALWYTLQYLHIIPFTMGPLQFYGFDLIAALLWGATTAIWIWAMRNLWNLRRDALTFITILSGWNLLLAMIAWLSSSSFQALLPQMVINGLILLYCFTPRVREAFGVA